MRRLVAETLARSAADGIGPRAAAKAVAADRLPLIEARFGWYR
jgi:glutamate dehydrogenase (NAD(P)+)